MTSTFLEDNRAKWQDWLERIGNDLLDLAVASHLHKETFQIVASNPALIGTPSTYWWFMDLTFGDYAILAVRRQLKDDGDSISLLRLLRQLREHPKSITRAWFEQPPPVECGEFMRLKAFEWSHGFFNQFAEPDEAHVSPSIVERDAVELKQALATVETFADRMVAHLDRRPAPPRPHAPELYAGIERVLEIFHRYRTLIWRGDHDFNIPQSVGEEWRDLFRRPWIEGSHGS